jgi:hypothetical protein
VPAAGKVPADHSPPCTCLQQSPPSNSIFYLLFYLFTN